jgi:hypothetical protein
MTHATLSFRRAMLAPGIAAAIVFCGAPVGAQQPEASQRPVAFGVGIGRAARPGGGVGTLGLGTLEFGTRWRNVDVRLDGVFASWPGNSSIGRLTSLTSNLVYSHPIGVFAPYLLTGIGAYARPGAGASFGVNGGVGFKASVRRLQPFVELREHVWSADRTQRATLFSLGLMF